MSKFLLSSLLVATICLIFSCSNKREGKPRVLVFKKAAGYVHESIGVGTAAIQKLGTENGFDVDSTSDAAVFNEDSLKKYATVIFLHTTGDVLNSRQEAAFGGISRQAEAMLVSMLPPMLNMTGDGMADW